MGVGGFKRRAVWFAGARPSLLQAITRQARKRRSLFGADILPAVGRIGCVALLAWTAARADVLAAAGLAGPPVLIVEQAPGHQQRTPLQLRDCPEGECVDIKGDHLSAQVKFERSDVGYVLE